MPHCEYEEIVGEDADSEGYRYVRCTHCGEVVRTCFTVEKLSAISDNRECPHPSERIPLSPTKNIFQMGVSYLSAYIRHMANGRPQATPQQTLARYRLCSACESYNPPTGQCGLCACYVAPSLVPAYANKLSWADEECPRLPPVWPRLDRPPPTNVTPNVTQEQVTHAGDKPPIND